MFPESTSTDSLRDLRGGELQAALLGRFRERGWAEHTLEVIAQADPHRVAGFRRPPHTGSLRANLINADRV